MSEEVFWRSESHCRHCDRHGSQHRAGKCLFGPTRFAGYRCFFCTAKRSMESLYVVRRIGGTCVAHYNCAQRRHEYDPHPDFPEGPESPAIDPRELVQAVVTRELLRREKGQPDVPGD